MPLAGRPLVEWSVAAFRAAESVGAIVVACPPGHIHELGGHDLGVVEGGPSRSESVSNALEASAPAQDHDLVAPGLTVVAGGETRSESVANALAAVGTELVVVHDAARPLVTPQLVEGVVSTLVADPEADAAIAATPVTDTVKRVDTGEAPGEPSSPAADRVTTFAPYGVHNRTLVVEKTLDRSRLWAAQTPQAFRTEALRAALAAWRERAGADPERVAEATDEAMLVEAAGGRVLIHPAPSENLKVTTPLDLRLAELLLA